MTDTRIVFRESFAKISFATTKLKQVGEHLVPDVTLSVEIDGTEVAFWWDTAESNRTMRELAERILVTCSQVDSLAEQARRAAGTSDDE